MHDHAALAKKPNIKMKIPDQVFLLLALVIEGCQSNATQTAKQDTFDTIRSERKETVKRSVPALRGDTMIVDNKFSFDALAFEIFKADTTKVKSLFMAPVVLKTEKRKNAEGGAYDLYNFTDGINKLTLYFNEGFYLQEGIVKNGNVLLNKKISIGMTKDKFLKLVKKTGIKCDTIIAVNDESTFETVYIFNDAKLRQIQMGQILE